MIFWERAGKRGELTSKQLVTIIILIISFSVILLFFLVLNPKSEITKETCRNSVILKGSTPLGKDTVKLQCTTQDVCITQGKGCSTKGSNTLTLQVQSKDELVNSLTDLMYDCWWQMGNGKVNYAPNGWEGQYCVICNVINFDNSIQSKPELQKISMLDLFTALQQKKVPGSEASYLYNIYGLNSVGAALDAYNDMYKGEFEQSLRSSLDFSTVREYALITSTSEGADLTAVLAATAVGAGAGSLIFPVIGTTIGAGLGAIIGGLGAGGTAFFVTSGDSTFLAPHFVPFNGEAIQKLGCKEFSSLS